MVAVTNRRVITASPQDFIQKGTVTGSYPLEELTWDFLNEQDSLAQLHVTHEQRHFEWCFPSVGREAAQELATAVLSRLFPKAMQTGSFLPKTNPGLGNQFFASATLTLTS